MSHTFDSNNPSTPTEMGSLEIQNENTILSENANEKEEQLQVPDRLPILPVRDMVIFNYTIMPLFVGRESSIQAVQTALDGSRYMMILTQKNADVENPVPADLYDTGTIVMIMRMLKLPDGRLKLLVQGVSRAEATAIFTDKPYLEAEVQTLPEKENIEHSVELEALMRVVREQSERILTLRGITSPDIINVLASIDHPGRLADIIASNLRLKLEEAQDLISTIDPVKRLKKINELLSKETEVATMQAQIQESAREGIDKAQRDYFLREQLKAIKKELGEAASDTDDDLMDLSSALEKANLPPEVDKEAKKQFKRLQAMHNESSEAAVIRTYLELLAELPWTILSKDRINIDKAAKILDEDHYGLGKVKERILEFLAIKKLNPKSKSPILCFVGPPGVGKTSLGRSIARALGRKFQRMSVGGVRDEAEIRGHRRTYVGALPGRIIQSIKQAGTRNPVIMLDEIDKIGADYRGDPSSALLEVLDPEQNNSFSDHYLNVPFDLSKVMFICTANILETIPKPLLDRMELIRLPGYTLQEKEKIAQRYLLPRQIKENGLKKQDVILADQLIEQVIAGYTRESGVRNLEREIGTLCRKLAKQKASGEKGPFTVSLDQMHALLGAPRFLDEDIDIHPVPGVAVGLAWTPHGGEVLNVEVSTMQGKGGINLTGQLGDVMKESAQAAISYARANAERLGINPSFNNKLDIHIHVPAGATPKDGPSAGVTLATALISALKNKSVAPRLCMTGEITLRGKILPVGGIKEKILAAVAHQRSDVLIPKQNIKDLEDIPAELLAKIHVHPVTTLDEVLTLAFPDERSEKKKSSGQESKKILVKKTGSASACA